MAKSKVPMKKMEDDDMPSKKPMPMKKKKGKK